MGDSRGLFTYRESVYALKSIMAEAEEQQVGSSYEHLHQFKLDVFNHHTSKTNILN